MKLSARYLWLGVSQILVFALPSELLELQRRAVIDSGEIWRLFTAHWTHVGLEHLILNVLGTLVLAELFDIGGSVHGWLICLLVLALGVSVGLLLFLPDLVWYRGFSGCLHGLFVYEAIRGFREQPKLALTVLGLIVGKLTLEALGFSDPRAEIFIGAPIIEAAHTAGALFGAFLALVSMGVGSKNKVDDC